MNLRHGLIAAAWAALGLGATTVSAATPGEPAQAERLHGPITLDGKLDEADWRAAVPLSRFVEIYPGDRSPPPERTEVRFLYDDRFLYVGFRGFLRDPSGLRKPFVRRDKVGSSHDYIQVYIDPLGAQRGAYLFRVNARGVKTDGLQDEAKQSETLDPDFDWDVATSIDDQGWSAELRIPLSTLRIAKVGEQRWWVIVTRGVPRGQNTQMATAAFPHDASCFLCYASELTLKDLTPKTETLFVVPSATITGLDETGPAGRQRGLRGQGSLDVKWLPYPGAAVDLTIKPDFSQVEADAPQLTANTRFAINLPEKRPFFREGLDLVSTPIPALYTRTIAAPEVGLRYTHRSAGLNSTVFLARDAGRTGIIEPGLLSSSAGYPTVDADAAFGHAKVGLGAADAGVLGAVKQNLDGSYNAVAGPDASWGDSTDRVAGQVLASRTRDPNRPDLLSDWHGQSLSGLAASLEWDHAAATVWQVRYSRYDDGFRSWLGYVPRVGYQEASADLRHPFSIHRGFINDLIPYIDYDALIPLHHDGGEGGAVFGLRLVGAHNLTFDLSAHPDAGVLTAQGDQRRTSYVQWTMTANPRPRIPLVEFDGTVGEMVDFATGEVVPGSTLTAGLRARPLDRLELEGRVSRSVLGDGPGSRPRLEETTGEFLATWYLSARFHVLGDLQLDRTIRRLPVADRSASSLASVQFVWEASHELQLYWGVRNGLDHPEDPTQHARSTEVYFKLTRSFATRL